MPNRDWFQILTNIGVVAGLAILVYELNQSNNHMDAQMVDSAFQMSFQTNFAVLGENPAPVIAKACTQSGKLSLEDQVVLDAFHNSRYIELDYTRVMALLGILGEKWVKPATRQAYIFAHPAGVEWWERKRSSAHNDLVDVIDKGIANGEHHDLCSLYGDITNAEERG